MTTGRTRGGAEIAPYYSYASYNWHFLPLTHREGTNMPYPAESLVRDGHLRSMHTPSALAVHMAIYVLGPDALTEDICQQSGLSPKTLTKCLDNLVELRLLDIERISGRNRYRLLGLPEVCDDGESDSDPPNHTPPAHVSRRGVFHSRDGHSCASELEARVDDLLHHLGIWHAREVPYATLIAAWDGKHTADFVLAAGLAIEVAGHTGSEYRTALNEKVGRATAKGWRVLVVQSGNLYDIIDEQLVRDVTDRLNQHGLRMLRALYQLAPDDLCSKRLLRPRIQTLVDADARTLRESVVRTVIRDNKTAVDAYKLSHSRGVREPAYALMLRSALVDAATKAGDDYFALHIRAGKGLPDEFLTVFATLDVPSGDALVAAEADLASRPSAVPSSAPSDESEAPETDQPGVDTSATETQLTDVSRDEEARQGGILGGILGAIRRLLGLGSSGRR